MSLKYLIKILLSLKNNNYKIFIKKKQLNKIKEKN